MKGSTCILKAEALFFLSRELSFLRGCGVSLFNVWACWPREDIELQKAKGFVTQKCNCEENDSI